MRSNDKSLVDIVSRSSNVLLFSLGAKTVKTHEPSKQSRLSRIKASVREDTRERAGGESSEAANIRFPHKQSSLSFLPMKSGSTRASSV